MVFSLHMATNKEKPKPAGWRVLNSHRAKVARSAKKKKVSQSEFMRRMIDAHCV